MAEYHANTARPLESSQARRRAQGLNPIIEENEDGKVTTPFSVRDRRTDLKIEAWLSPMSDHFPTPRGMHYLPAPVLPSSPSTESGVDSPAGSINPWNRASVTTDATEFEDLYDVTDDEDIDELVKMPKRMSSLRSRPASRQQPTPIVIPESKQASVQETTLSAVDEFKKIVSPIPLTPSVKFTISPAQQGFMDQQQAIEVPTSSAPPSLDGSLSSEQLALLSSPPTPDIGDDEINSDDAWTGVRLQPGALATLQSLSSTSSSDVDPHEHPTPVLEVHQPLPESQPATEMQQSLRLFTTFRSQNSQIALSNQHRQSLADLTSLDIPSPAASFPACLPEPEPPGTPRQPRTLHLPLLPLLSSSTGAPGM